MNGAVPHLADPFKRVGISVLELILVCITLIVGWIVWSVMSARNAQTPAMSRVGVRVISLRNNQPASLATMAVRELLVKAILMIPAIFITFVVGDHLFTWWTPFLVFAFWYVGGSSIFFTKEHQAIWDVLANTTVVDVMHTHGDQWNTPSSKVGDDKPRGGRVTDRTAW